MRLPMTQANPWGLNMPQGVTPISHDIFQLHMATFWICVAIGVVVFGLLIYTMIRHRKSKGYKPAKFSHNKAVEAVWIIVPTLILIGVAVPSTLVLMRMDDDAQADINIKVTGYQWKWKYDYLDQGISFFSVLSTPQAQLKNEAKKNKWYLLQVDKPLVVPIHKKIRFLVTSNDVIHSWWVPDLGVKRDAIPGFIHEAWARIEKPGTYRGQCAELCGMNHGYMPIVVVAKTESAFKQWVAAQSSDVEPKDQLTSSEDENPMTYDDLMSKGKNIYSTTCAVCHKENGEGMPPAFPALKGGKITTGPLQAHIDMVLSGKPGTAMQAFKKQLTKRQLAAVITYERNSWGNNNKEKYGKQAGGTVSLSDIVGGKNKKGTPSPKKPAAPLTKQALMAAGKKTYDTTCSVCHKPDGSGMPPTFPALKGGAITTGPVKQHIDIVLNGKSGTTMQAFKSQLNDKQLAGVITYERNSWGNNNQKKYGKQAGGIVSIEEIKKARK